MERLPTAQCARIRTPSRCKLAVPYIVIKAEINIGFRWYRYRRTGQLLMEMYVRVFTGITNQSPGILQCANIRHVYSIQRVLYSSPSSLRASLRANGTPPVIPKDSSQSQCNGHRALRKHGDHCHE